MTTKIEPILSEKLSTKNVKSYLVSHVTLKLHTHTAISLIDGKWQPGHMGLLQFVTAVNYLWRAVKEDDLYAEYYLIKIYEGIESVREDFKRHEEEMTCKMQNLRGFSLDVFANPEPLTLPLKFSTPFGFMAAFVIENADYLTRQIFTLNRLGLMSRKDRASINIFNKVQKIFALPIYWKYTGVTRKDIQEQNQKSIQAKQLLKINMPDTLFEALLNKQIKFSYLPRREETKVS